MIKPLRKRHLEIWMAIALLLPAGIIFSWLVIPNPVPIKKISSKSMALLPIIQEKRETLLYCINIRSDADKTNWQLEWKNKLPLTVPSAVIYRVPLNPVGGRSFKPGDAALIGRIEAKGDYIFPLKNDSTQNAGMNFMLYDFIHEKIIDSINFK